MLMGNRSRAVGSLKDTGDDKDQSKEMWQNERDLVINQSLINK